MYIRIKTSKLSPRKSVQIVDGTREGAKVKQKIIQQYYAVTNPKSFL